MPDAAYPGPSPLLLWALTMLTVVSGMVDAVSYLGLGHVFTANMTGNVVVLGFAAAGAPGFSMAATSTSIGAFLVGAVAAGRIAVHVTSKRHWFLSAMVAEAVLAGGTAVVSASAGTIGTGWARFTVIAMLAFAMGIRNSTVRRMAVPDVTTTVLTMTLTGLASDSTLAGGRNPRAGRRAGAFAAMLIGAFAGAALYLHLGATAPLAAVAGVVVATAVVFAASPASRRLDVTT
ncbi:MAG: YoaK family protein [Acidimicrobiales bacterium]